MCPASGLPQVRFATTSDGVRIAYRVIGSGPPLVFVRGWISHLDYIGREPKSRAFFEALASARSVIQYDARGNGLSDREVDDISLDALVRDLEAIVEHLGIETCDLYGQTFGGPIAVAYAVAHPERVSRLILDGAYACGRDLTTPDKQAALIASIRAFWSAAVRVLDDLTYPDAVHERTDLAWTSRAVSAKVAAQLYELAYEIDIRDLLPELRLPVLILHRRGSHAVPFRFGRELASLIPGAQFVPLEGSQHNPWSGDVAGVLDAVGDFLGVALELPAGSPFEETQVPLIVLFTDIVGHTEMMQRLGDERGRAVLREHERIVREALRRHRGAEVKTIGDAFMVSFTSASSAIEWAIAIQRTFARRNERAEVPLSVRVGLNAGEPIAEQEDLFGTAVIIAQRICGQAGGGQILVANVVKELVAGKGFLFADCGDAVLRGFEDPVRLYEVRWEP